MGWKARFVPEAWINDYAVEVDSEGETDWDLTDDEALKILPEAQSTGADLDFLRDHPGAPQWVRNWHGPFTVRLVNPDGFTI